MSQPELETEQSPPDDLLPVFAAAQAPRPIFNISVAQQPKHLRLSEQMITDFIGDPGMAATILFKQNLDEFQKTALTIGVWSPRVMDSSGWSSSKTFRMWMVATLRCLLIPNHHALVAYPSFSTGQRSFWEYFGKVAAISPIFRAQVGKPRIVGIDGKAVGESKAQLKGQSCWEFNLKNGSKVMLPAVGFLQDARNIASIRINDLYIDEHTKAEATGSTGIDDQLIGRATRENFNQDHPFWCNHHYFAATAEDTMHPSFARYKSYLDEVNKGNPDYALLSYSFKDYSDFQCGNTGRTFKEKYRDEKNIRDMRKNKTAAGFRQEGLGIWSKNGKGWYTPDLIDRCYINGAERGVVPMANRRDDWEKDKARLNLVHYFMSLDPARAETKKADDGAMMAMRAIPRVEHPTHDPIDWQVDFIWAYLLRKADLTQWSAVTHRKHQNFGFSGIIVDAGPAGGGNYLKPELAKSRQIIREREVKVRPIATEEDEASMVSADFILSMFKRGDAKIDKLIEKELYGEWTGINPRGDDVLIDAAHKSFHNGLELGIIGAPPRLRDIPRDVLESWSEERRESARLIQLAFQQLKKVTFRTNDDGSTYYSKNNAREFSAKGRKDFAYCMVYLYVRFLQWLQTYASEEGDQLSDDDANLCG